MRPELLDSITSLHKSLPKLDLWTIDVGNTFAKRGLFKKGNLEKIEKNLKTPIENPNNHPQIISSVSDNIQSSFSWSGQSFLSAPINYESTLGHDRLVEGAHLYQISLEIDRPIIILNAGTFATIDLVDNQGFRGGFILPGIHTFAESYNSGAKLPSIPINGFEGSFSWPTTTEAAIGQSISRYISFISSSVEAFAREHGAFILISGGAAELLATQMSETQDHEIIPDLIHYSLYFAHCKLANL